jgi:hypothetical protein
MYENTEFMIKLKAKKTFINTEITGETPYLLDIFFYC